MRLGNTMLLFMNLGKQLYQFFRYPEKWQTSVPIWRISTPGWYYFQMVPWYYTFPKLEGTSACVEYHFVLRYKHRIWPTVHAIFTGWHRKPRDIPTVTLRYWIQESSLMKYPTHPSGRGRKRPYPALGMCWIFHSGWFLHPISRNIPLGKASWNISRYSMVFCHLRLRLSWQNTVEYRG